jgi:hypothetical protein
MCKSREKNFMCLIDPQIYHFITNLIFFYDIEFHSNKKILLCQKLRSKLAMNKINSNKNAMKNRVKKK